MENRRISIETGVTLEVLEANGGDLRLLLVHGFTGAKEDFADHLDELASHGWHVVAPDLRGHGRSDAPAGSDGYSFKTLAADVLALVEALEWSTFTLLGHSMGGMVAQVAALEAKSRLDGLILMDTSHGPIGGIDLDTIALAKAVVAQGGMEALVEAQRDQPGALGTEADERLKTTRPGYREFGEAKVVASSADMWLGMIDEVVTSQADRLSDLAGDLAGVPTLVIVGEQDAPFVPHARRMAEAIPGARLEVVADAGHSPQFENPDEWLRIVSGFLAGLPAG